MCGVGLRAFLAGEFEKLISSLFVYAKKKNARRANDTTIIKRRLKIKAEF